jgi:hypothetical protein
MAADDRDDASQHRPSPPGRRPPGAAALSAVVGPFTHTGTFYAQSWRDYLKGGVRELPIARPSLALAAHAFRDEIILLGLRARRPISDAPAFGRIDAEVGAALDFYGRRGWLDSPARFFARPAALTDVAVRHVKAGRRSYERIFFESDYVPRRGEPGRQRWLGYTANQRVYALMLRHKENRPWLVCVHGAEMGRAALDLMVFRAWHLHNDLGLNVVLPVLPMHGPRGRGLPRGVTFPAEDVMDNVHAAAQAVWDIRRLLSWIRSQQPESPIGVYGISLGGYVASLVASIDDGLTCALLGVPVADLIGLLGRHAAFRDGDPRRKTVALAEPIGRMVSPLSLDPRVPLQGRFIYAGVADRVVHPREQAIRLWEHWDTPEIAWYQGGHTGFLESRPVQQFVDAALLQSGLVEDSSTIDEPRRPA